jgi:hypothetical protein
MRAVLARYAYEPLIQDLEMRIGNYVFSRLGAYFLTATPEHQVQGYSGAIDEPSIDGLVLGVRLHSEISFEGSAVYAIADNGQILYIGISENRALGDRLGWYQSRFYARRSRSFKPDGDTRNRLRLIETMLDHLGERRTYVPLGVFIYSTEINSCKGSERQIENEIKALAAWNGTSPEAEIRASSVRLTVKMKKYRDLIRLLATGPV